MRGGPACLHRQAAKKRKTNNEQRITQRKSYIRKMKTRQGLLLFLSVLLFSSACKKTKVTPTPTNNEPTEQIIEIKTSYGTMYMWLYKQTPKHRENFLKLTSEGYFDNTTFHRIIPNFVIQGGDPNTKDSDTTNDGSGGPTYTIPAELVDSLKHVFGAVGAARDNNPAKASHGSQFYIVTNVNGQSGLDKNYTVFGKIISGMTAATTIMMKPRNSKDRPYTDIKIDVNVVNKTLAQLKAEFNFVP